MANKLDRNASSPNRIRRNFQRIVKGGGLTTTLIPGDTSLKLIGNNLAVNIAPSQGLQTLSTGVGVQLAPNGGLENTTNGILEYGFRSASSSPLVNNGDTYYDTTLNCPITQSGGATLHFGGGLYSSIVDSNSVGNTTTETTFNTTYTIPANYLTVTKTLHLYVAGQANILGPSSPARSVIIRLYLGVNNFAAVFVTFSGSSIATGDYILDLMLTCRSAGSSGTMYAVGNGLAFINGVGGFVPTGYTTIVPFDTTSPQVVSATAQWTVAVAGDTCVTNLVHLHVMN